MDSDVAKKPKDLFHIRAILILGVIALVGILLRFFADSPLWLDEAISASIAEEGPRGIVEALRNDGHPPLYYFLLHFWSLVVGDSDFALRAMSGVFSTSSLFLVYRFMRKATDSWVGALTVGVLAISPFAIRYATEVRMYSLLVLLILIGHILIEKVWRSPTPLNLLGVSCVIAGLLYTHYWSLFLVSALCLVLFFCIVSGDKEVIERSKKLSFAVGLGIATFVPWLPIFLEQLSHTGTPWSDAPRPTVVVALTLEAYGGGRGSEALLVAVLIVVLAGMGLFLRKQEPEAGSITILGRTEHKFLLISVLVGVLAMFFGIAASLIFDSAFQGRYGAFAFIPLVLAIGVGLGHLSHRIGIGLLVILALVSVISVARELSHDRTQIGEVAASIEKNGTVGDTVVFCPDQLAPAAHRVLEEEFNLYAYPSLDSGQRVNWYDYEERNSKSDPVEIAKKILSLHIQEQSIWLVWIDGYKTFGSQCGKLKEELNASSSNSRVFVHAGGEDYYNSANLVRFTK